MKLNKDTRNLLREGSILKQEGMTLEVTQIIPLQRGAQVTVKILKHPQKWCEGRMIYAQPMSSLYGMVIEN